ncbi:protein SEY1, putative [Entamoeba histolytica HM-1:IMSS-A]|uniref:Protein SEY1 homolog n=1 Tax=Entamoeba histolytica HM-1:IMSS-A TaxID=885318 RepID=N9UP32_ENTH1|nr:protein SEY1, putative [Entamoeba histolytica HM-1:IMSS-A]
MQESDVFHNQLRVEMLKKEEDEVENNSEKKKAPGIDMNKVNLIKTRDEDIIAENIKAELKEEEKENMKVEEEEIKEEEEKKEKENYPCMQIIDQEGIFADENQKDRITFEEFIQENTKFKELGFNYNMLSILGPQNSGKSTLLNYLFDTDFAVLNEKNGRQRTTRGVWLGLVGDRKDIIIMDLEGSDGSIREDDLSFERKISLFSLSVCSVLMVNIWSHDVGRYGASNMSLLKNIFELNLQLFQKEDSPKTLILFVIRDRDQRKPFENTKSVLLEDIMKIWESVARPECFKRAPIDKFFDLEFTSLPHFKHDKELFIQEAKELKKRFDCKNQNTYFRPIYNKEIPADGLALFTKQVWSAIKSNKDLDLPSQKEMLARFRCDELIENIFNEFEKEIEEIKLQHSEKHIFNNFKIFCDCLYDKKMKEFMNVASKYLDRVVKEKADLLSEKMLNEISYLFQTQMTLAINYIKTMLTTSYFTLKNQYITEQSSLFDPTKYAGYAEQMDDFNSTIKNEWEKISTQSVPSNIENNFEIEINTLDRFINKLYEIGRRDLIEALMTHFKKHLQNIMKPLLLPLFEQSNQNMWEQVRKVVIETTSQNLQELENGMINSLKMNKDDVEKKLNELQVYIIDAVRSTILERPGFVSNLMENKFISIFRLDDEGLPKKWKQNEDLSKPFFKAKEEAEKILDLFSYIRMDPKDDELSFISINPATGKKMIIEEPENGTIDQTKVLFSLSERLSIYEGFQNMAESNFIRAQQELAAITVHSKTPMWLILLIAFLSFDNIVYVFKSPTLLALTLIIIGIIYSLNKIGYAYLIDSVISYILSISWSSVLYLIQDLGLFKNLLPKPEAPKRKRPQKKTQDDKPKPSILLTHKKQPSVMGDVTMDNIDSLNSFDDAFKLVSQDEKPIRKPLHPLPKRETQSMKVMPMSASFTKSQSMFIKRNPTTTSSLNKIKEANEF